MGVLKQVLQCLCGVVFLVVVISVGWKSRSSVQVHMVADAELWPTLILLPGNNGSEVTGNTVRTGSGWESGATGSVVTRQPSKPPYATSEPSKPPYATSEPSKPPYATLEPSKPSYATSEPPRTTSLVTNGVLKNYSTSPPNRRLPAFGTNPASNLNTGYLNYDLWHWIVGYLVDDMRIVREFPLYPDDRRNISHLHVKFNEVDQDDLRDRYGHKIYGYITPPEPGSYSFQVELTELTAAAEVELWISTTSNPLNMSLILNLLYPDTSRPTKRVATTKLTESEPVQLGSGSYYFEFLQKAFEGSIVTDVKWKTPSSKEYVPVPSSCFTMAAKLDGDGHYAAEQSSQFLLNGRLPSDSHMTHHRVDSASTAILPITDLNVLPKCTFKALYASTRKVGHKKGFFMVHESSVYPKDETWYHDFKKADRGNKVIKTEVMSNVVNLYKKALSGSELVNASVVKLRNLEQTINKNDGSRFLLEMDVQLHQPKEEIVHTSEYVYLKKDITNLCHTSNFQWTKDAFVHFIVSVKNLGQWVRHLIYNMEDIQAQTGDERFGLIIVDFQSADMDIEQEVRRSSFKRITVLHKKGAFSRAGGLQEAINHIKNPDEIITTIDMHLTLPKGFVEYVRKRTVHHMMALTPLFFKLNKGYTEIDYNGSWRVYTYGIFSMYKSDWTKTGGFDTVHYTTKWGDEDWDALDRALSKGMEAYRIRPPGFVHYHHTKKGLWGNSDIDFKDQHWTVHS